MNFTQAVKSGFNQYAGFTGRAPRSEFWFWVLFCWLASLVGNVFDFLLFGHEVSATYAPTAILVNLALLVPSIAVGARRFHDMDRTGWWQLIAVTGIGALVLLVWCCFKGTEGPNRFGPDPLAR